MFPAGASVAIVVKGHLESLASRSGLPFDVASSSCNA
jgi:hypothetical protein